KLQVTSYKLQVTSYKLQVMIVWLWAICISSIIGEKSGKWVGHVNVFRPGHLARFVRSQASQGALHLDFSNSCV
ncbi:MAG: hypothetical protein ACLFTI_12530, partial [Anaerolineales bacterium]